MRAHASADAGPAWAGRVRGALGLAAALSFLGGCGHDPAAPSWIHLAQGFTPRPLQQLAEGWERAAGAPTGTRLEPQTLGLGLVHDVAASDWAPAGEPGCLAVTLPGGGFRAAGVAPRLVGRGREFAPAAAGREPRVGEVWVDGAKLMLRLPAGMKVVPQSLLVLESAEGAPLERPIPSVAWHVADGVGRFACELPPEAVNASAAPRLFTQLVGVDAARPLTPYEYRIEPERVVLCWPDAGPPPAMQLVVRLENGRDTDGSWQLRLGRFCGNGIPVWSGEREELVRDVPPASALSFRFVHGAKSGEGEVRARVRLDGAVLVERSLAAGAAPLSVSVPLPEDGERAARLAFEVEGAPGLGAFFAPTLGPREHGNPGARPWPAARPDLVLFLVDTLRADVLAAYGGDPALAPALARFGATCVRFREARSNAAWTLPSISSILTGLHPGQHGATDEDLSLAAFHTTLAEELALAGYRTGALTDGSFFSPIFGLEQGFEWFAQRDERQWDVDATIAEARDFLAQDDGRPVFLVVHTYRVHQPYRVGPDEDRSAYDALLAKARAGSETASPEATAGFGLLEQFAPELRALYEAGVRDLDRAAGEFLSGLEAQRFFEHGYLAFTSDHGEALGENHEFFHGRTLYETKLRVPLFLRGPGLAPREVRFSASPVDLAPTFAELARLPRDPGWVGSSLLALDADRPSFAFQLAHRSRQVAIDDAGHKVLTTPERARLVGGQCEHAFELERDPLEEHDVVGSTDWPAELTRRLAPAVLEFLEPRGPEQAAGVSSELREELDRLGYGGGK